MNISNKRKRRYKTIKLIDRLIKENREKFNKMWEQQLLYGQAVYYYDYKEQKKENI